jgi:RimJ/RimL family protein N-acetyltransferase
MPAFAGMTFFRNCALCASAVFIGFIMTSENKNPILFDLPMPIRTPRLILRNPLPGDGAFLHEAKLETWDMLNRWMPWAKETGTVDDDEIIIREAYARFIKREDMMIFGFEADTGKLVLSSGLHRFDWEVRRFEIGYWVRKSAQGKGYATECANALTRYAFGVLGASAVAIDVAEGNEASMAVVNKLGFEKEGVLRKSNKLPGGEIADHHVWSCLSPDNLPPLDVKWGE